MSFSAAIALGLPVEDGPGTGGGAGGAAGGNAGGAVGGVAGGEANEGGGPGAGANEAGAVGGAADEVGTGGAADFEQPYVACKNMETPSIGHLHLAIRNNDEVSRRFPWFRYILARFFANKRRFSPHIQMSNSLLMRKAIEKLHEMILLGKIMQVM